MQGRTVYGGIGAALAVEATRRAVPGLGPLRSAQIAFIGPGSGRLSLSPTVLRAGRSVTFVSVEVSDGGSGIATRALLCFGAARPSTLSYLSLPMPSVPPAHECPPLSFAQGASGYLTHFEARAAGPGRPAGGLPTAEITAWHRHRESSGVDDTVALVALGDVSPPAPMALFDRLVPVSTMMWSFELGPEPGRGGPDGWRLVEVVADTLVDGYAAERITVWSQDGTPLMTARQSVAIFG